jgi:hypothetical protein
MLERLFGSSSRAKIIKFFCTHTTGSFYLRELARTLDIQLNAISRELDNLVVMGFLIPITRDHKKYYRVNSDFSLLHELTALIIKSIVLLERAVISDLQKVRGIQLFILTGIFINEDTGTDILIVGSPQKKMIQKIINALSRSFYQDLRFTILTTSEYRYRLEVTDKFLYAIMNQGPVIITDKITRHG